MVAVFIAAYGLITKDFEFLHYLIFLLGSSMLVAGLQEFQKGQKMYGWLFIFVFLLSLLAIVQGFY